jgi:hypothetical protein
VLAIVLEVQRDKDHDKKYAWPVYVVTVRAKKRCPACVLVVATDGEVAAWAGEAIALGPGGTIAPMVLGPSVVPVITDQAEAKQESELAILSAVVHGNGPNGLTVVEAALSALGKFDAEHAAVYFQIVYDALREPLRRAVEALIMERQSEAKPGFPPFMQELIDRGKHEGELRGELRGELKGELKGKRDALLRLVTRAGIVLAEDDRARIFACMDPATLEQWVENVLGAKTAADVLS